MQRRLKSYGGIATVPGHPAGDMHNLVRVCIGAKSIRHACQSLARFGVHVRPSDFARVWGETKAIVEVCLTKAQPDIPFVAALQSMYLSPQQYQAMKAKDRVVRKSA
jgi:hypothetical protein